MGKKKIYIFIVIVLSLFILTGCDASIRLSDKEDNEVLNKVSIIIKNDNNWQTNYLYRSSENYLISINGENFYKNVDDINHQNEIQEKYVKIKNRLVSIFEDDKQNMQISGWNVIGSYKIIFITLLNNEVQQEDYLSFSFFSCSILKDGSFHFNYEYEIDSVKYIEIIELLVDEKKLQNYT